MKFETFEKEILEWYKENGRKHLPWRKKNITAYEVWVSEIMLQQTQVSRVIEYYNRFLEKFPTVQDLASATWEEFYPFYVGLGYYNRGRNMLKTAQIVVDKYKGKFPEDKKELVSLPGIGDYTASAILSFAYGKDELAFDTNVKKVLGRVFFGTRNINAEEVKQIIEEYHFKSCHSEERSDEESLKQISKRDSSLLKGIQNDRGVMRELNAAIMDFSNRICIKIPRCGECPLRNICEYYKTDGQDETRLRLSYGVARETGELRNFSNKDAQVYLWLHKDHKEYYSTNKKKFKPFILNAKYNTREKIKQYFKEKYNLELSVRPPHKKTFIDGEPTFFVNAQIQTGEHNFYVFSKSEISRI